MPLDEDFYDDDENYGDEDQNDIMQMIRRHEEETPSMEISEKIDQLMKEIEIYKEAQDNACYALESAEMELTDILDEEYRSANKA